MVVELLVRVEVCGRFGEFGGTGTGTGTGTRTGVREGIGVVGWW